MKFSILVLSASASVLLLSASMQAGAVDPPIETVMPPATTDYVAPGLGDPPPPNGQNPESPDPPAYDLDADDDRSDDDLLLNLESDEPEPP
jgi:hypothetical protein